MKTFALYTGGKDSTYSIKITKEMGHEVEAIVTFISDNIYSYMFHTVNANWTHLHAITMKMTHYLFKTTGVKEVELRDLDEAFGYMRRIGFEGVVTGAVASRYQRDRISNLAEKNKLKVFSPLWGYDQEKLLWELFENKIIYMITSVAALGLNENNLGWVINTEEDVTKLIELSKKYSFNPSGEGGEYETFVLHTEFFKYPIEVQEVEKHWFGDSGYLIIKKADIKIDHQNRFV